jgi:hypothetical protein
MARRGRKLGNVERDLRTFVLSSACLAKPHQRLVALALVSLGDWSTGIGYASQKAIAAACGVSDRTLRDTLLQLRANSGSDGWPIYETWGRASPDGNRLPNGYRVLPPGGVLPGLPDETAGVGGGVPPTSSLLHSRGAGGLKAKPIATAGKINFPPTSAPLEGPVGRGEERRKRRSKRS